MTHPRPSLLLPLVALAACSEAREPAGSFGRSAQAATLPAIVPTPARPSPDVNGASGDGAAEPAVVLDLEAVDGMPEPGGSRVVELPSPTARMPACLRESPPCGATDAPWVETREGFVTAWGVLEPTDAKRRKEADPTALLALAGAELRPLVAPGPVVELAPQGTLERKAAAPVWLLASRVHAPAERPARLMLSVNGAARVALNGRVVHEEVGDQHLLLDHRTIAITLAAGWNTFAIRLEKVSPYAVKLSMRLRAPDGMPLDGVAWALPEGVAPAPHAICASLDASLTARLARDDWRLEAAVAARGLLPWPLPSRVALKIGEAVVAERDLDPAHTATALEARTPDPTAGHPVALELLVDGETCARLDLGRVPERERFLAAEATLVALRGDATRLGPGDLESLEYQSNDVRGLIEEAARGGAPRRLEGTLAHFEAHVAGAAAGTHPFQAPGLHVRAYRSEYDGSLQRYVVVVPSAYRGDAPAPLIMLAHGLAYTPEDMMRIALGKPSGPGEALRTGVIYKWDPPEPPSGAILVAHDGYGDAGQRAPGEVDVRRVIGEMKAAYRIDPRRVSISGFSLGGSVAFWVPFRTPSEFSAAAPLCGYPNILEYRSVKNARKRPWEPRLLDEEGVAPYAEGGRYLPLKMVHGAMDGPQRSELIHDRYKALRYSSELDVPPLGHNVWDLAYEDGKLLKWLAARRRPAVAPQPVVRSGRYRWSTNYWLRIDRFTDESQFGQVDGAFKGDRLEVVTRNVSAFTILGDELGERAGRPQTVVVDGRALGAHTVGEALHLTRATGTWAVAERLERSALTKRPGLEGPLGDVWFGPLVIVYGTRVPAELEANRLTAERMAMHAPWIDLRVPILADVDVQEADLVGRSVVLVGRPATNLLTERVAPALAEAGIRFADAALMIGERRFEGGDVGLSVIRPSPFDPERYLVLHAGLGPDGTLSARYLPELAPDFLVYDSRMREVFGDRILGPREALYGGFFDAAWHISQGEPPR